MSLNLFSGHKANFRTMLLPRLVKLTGQPEEEFRWNDGLKPGSFETFVAQADHWGQIAIDSIDHRYDDRPDVPKPYFSRFATFHTMQLPGCCGVCLSFHAETAPRAQNKGVGELMLLWRLYLARADKFTLFICTTRRDNSFEMSLLERNGFRKLEMFNNRRTSADVYLMSRVLSDDDMSKFGERADAVLKRKKKISA